MKTSRIALADAAAFAILWTLFCAVMWATRPDKGWKEEGEDAKIAAWLLVTLLIGSGVVFWRVRSAYKGGAVSLRRAVAEGVAGALAAYYLCWAVGLCFAFFFQDMTWADIRMLYFDGDVMDGLRPVLKVAAIGAVFAAAVWWSNRYVLSRRLPAGAQAST